MPGFLREKGVTVAMTLDEAMEAIDNNTIYNGIVMVALMWFARHQSQLVNRTE